MTFTPVSDWHLRGLVWSYGVATVLVLSYLWTPTRTFWDALDTQVAFALNSLVRTSRPEQLFWAFANLRVFDYIAAAILLTVLLTYVFRGANAPRRVRIARAVVVCVLLVAIVAVTREFLFKDVARNSPSLILEPFTRLSQTTPFDAKDHSGQSFPGDHATVVATFTFLLWFFAGRRYGLASCVLATLFVLPRLVSGAHWLSDAVIGGVVTALVTVPLVVFTPVQHRLVDLLLRLFEAVVGRDAHDRPQRADRQMRSR